MIKNYTVNANTLSWEFCENKFRKDYEKINAVICSESELLVYCVVDGVESIILLSHEGNILAQAFASDSFCIMYLQKHPRFGLCAVCSSVNSQGAWTDGYYSYDGATSFVAKSHAR